MKKFRSPLMRWIWRSVAVFFAVLFLYQLWLFAHVCWWVKYNPSSSAFMDTRLEIMQDKNPDAELRQKWVDEPTAGMGPDERWKMIRMVQRLWELKGLTVVFIELVEWTRASP